MTTDTDLRAFRRDHDEDAPADPATVDVERRDASWLLAWVYAELRERHGGPGSRPPALPTPA